MHTDSHLIGLVRILSAIVPFCEHTGGQVLTFREQSWRFPPPCTLGTVREVELWSRMDAVLPGGYAQTWADQVVLEDIGGRTVREALGDGVPCKRIWRAVWRQLELPDTLK